MSIYELKPMTETSWLLQKDGVRLALVTRNADGYAAMGPIAKKRFGSLDELSQFLGSKVEIKEPMEDDAGDVLGDIRGYPVKHTNITQLEPQDGIPVYARGRVTHAAGYYGIRFKNGWVSSYCPKLKTLQDNESIGPFTTKIEMLNAMSQKKREIDL